MQLDHFRVFTLLHEAISKNIIVTRFFCTTNLPLNQHPFVENNFRFSVVAISYQSISDMYVCSHPLVGGDVRTGLIGDASAGARWSLLGLKLLRRRCCRRRGAWGLDLPCKQLQLLGRTLFLPKLYFVLLLTLGAMQANQTSKQTSKQAMAK